MSKQPKLLVVDDQADICDFIREVAEPLGYDVTTMTVPQDSLKVYGKLSPDVIVLDIVMPNVDGIEILRGLGQARSTARILLVTGFSKDYLGFADQLAEAFGLPSVTALMKPLHVEELRAFLRGQ